MSKRIAFGDATAQWKKARAVLDEAARVRTDAMFSLVKEETERLKRMTPGEHQVVIARDVVFLLRKMAHAPPYDGNSYRMEYEVVGCRAFAGQGTLVDRRDLGITWASRITILAATFASRGRGESNTAEEDPRQRVVSALQNNGTQILVHSSASTRDLYYPWHFQTLNDVEEERRRTEEGRRTLCLLLWLHSTAVGPGDYHVTKEYAIEASSGMADMEPLGVVLQNDRRVKVMNQFKSLPVGIIMEHFMSALVPQFISQMAFPESVFE